MQKLVDKNNDIERLNSELVIIINDLKSLNKDQLVEIFKLKEE